MSTKLSLSTFIHFPLAYNTEIGAEPSVCESDSYLTGVSFNLISFLVYLNRVILNTLTVYRLAIRQSKNVRYVTNNQIKNTY